MSHRNTKLSAAIGLFALLAFSLSSAGSAAQEPDFKVPEPGVPEIFTLTGQFVRIAYNMEGYVSLGYRMANNSVGEEWMLLEMGATVRKGAKNYTLKRGALSLSTPDGKTIPLPSNKEFLEGHLQALQRRAEVIRDSINYFPPGASRACRIGFFAEIDTKPMPYDQVELSWQRACLGRIYFKVPGGIQYGQHFLNVQFEDSLVRVPFRILTKEEEKKFRKSWKDIKKEHEKAFKQ